MGEIEYAASANGGQVAYREIGGEGEPIVYATGSLVPIEVMLDDPLHARFLEGLAEFGHLYVFDRRGVGASDPPDWDAPLIAQWADDLATVLDAIGAERVTLVGHETGATVVLGLIRRQPARVSRAVLFHGPAGDPDSIRAVVDGWKNRMAAISARNLDEGHALIEAAMPSRMHDPTFRAWIDRAGRLGASPATAGRIWERVFREGYVDWESGLDAMQTPMLLVHRADCIIAPVSGSRSFAARLPSARLVVLPGADFAPYSGDVDALVAEIGAFLGGEHRAPPPERPLVALLFTDLVGSTEQARASGDSTWRGVLERHDQLVRAALGRHGGTLVKLIGDGVLATFPTASRALAGAADLRATVAELGIGVRMGVHVGEIERRGDEVAGVAIHIAARIMSQAGAGEILVSAAVPLVAAGGLHEFRSIGPRQLKGLDGEWELFALER